LKLESLGQESLCSPGSNCVRESLGASTTTDMSRIRYSKYWYFTGNATRHTVMKQKSLGYVKKNLLNLSYFVTGDPVLARVADLFVALALGLLLRIA
jgi:hypothetical protein